MVYWFMVSELYMRAFVVFDRKFKNKKRKTCMKKNRKINKDYSKEITC